MKISVIISTYGMERINDTHQSIDSIIAQEDEGVEIIVVVDRNEELSANLSGRYADKINMIISEKKGLSNARNMGVQSSNGDIVAFIDDDATACKGWLKAIRRGFSRDERTAVVTGHIEPKWVGDGMGWFPEPLYWVVSCSYKQTEDLSPVQTAIGTNMAIRKDVLLKMGGFHEKLGVVQSWKRVNGKWIQGGSLVGEERDMCIRISESGYRIIHLQDMCVRHKVYPYRITMKNLIARAYKEGLTKAYLKRKHSGNALDLERLYLFHALGNMLSGKKKFTDRMRGAGTLLVVVGAVGAGYVLSPIPQLE